MDGNITQLNLSVDANGVITNTDYLISLIEQAMYSPEVLDRLNNLYLNITTNNYANKEALETALAKKVTEFNLRKEAEEGKDNLLETLKESNASIRNQIRLINTSSNENVTGKATSYVEYIDPDTKEVYRIHVDDPQAINRFITAHADEIGEWTAKQIFEYFSKYINVTVEKYEPDKFLKDADAINHTALENPDDINYQRRLIEEYARRTNPNEDISEVRIVTDNLNSINPESDEIMWTTDGKNLLKFVHEAGEMQLIQLSDGKEMQKEEEQANEQDGIGETQDHEVLDRIDDENRAKYDDLANEQNDRTQELDMDLFNSLLEKREVYGTEFSELIEDKTNLYTQASLAMDALEQKIASGEVDEELYSAIQSFIEPIIHQIQYFGEPSLSRSDYRYYDRFMNLNEKYQVLYRNHSDKQKENGQAPKQLVYKDDHRRKPENRNGVINIIILIEAVLLTAIIISIIALIYS